MNGKRSSLFGLLALVILLSPSLSAQDRTIALNGKSYELIDPAQYARAVENGRLRRGSYVIDDEVLSVNGNKLTLRNAGIMNTFILGQPWILSTGTKVRVFVAVSGLDNLKAKTRDGKDSLLRYAEARVEALIGGSGQLRPDEAAARAGSGAEPYLALSPAEYDFFAATGQLREGGTYVIEDEVLSSGIRLSLLNAGLMNTFELPDGSANSYPLGAKVRVYARIVKLNTFYRHRGGRLEPVMQYAEATAEKVESIP